LVFVRENQTNGEELTLLYIIRNTGIHLIIRTPGPWIFWAANRPPAMPHFLMLHKEYVGTSRGCHKYPEMASEMKVYMKDFILKTRRCILEE
jgi:hypothetical protein